MEKVKNQMRLLGIYQLIGGLTIIILVCLMIIPAVNLFFSFPQLWIPAVFIPCLLALLSIYAGIQCIRLRRNSLLFSKINQLVQAVGFSLPGFTLVYFAGLHLGLGIQFTGDSNLLSQFGFFKMQFDFSGAGEGTFVLVNVVAILFLVWLTRLENVAAEEQPEANAGAELAERVLDYSGRY